MLSCLHRHILLSDSLELPKFIESSKLRPKSAQPFYLRCYFRNFSFLVSKYQEMPSGHPASFIFFLLPLFREVQGGQVTRGEFWLRLARDIENSQF